MSQEQLRIAALMNDKSDAGDIEVKVEKVVELTKASKDAAVVALHDCDYDLNRAVSRILEGDSDDHWTSVSSKSRKEKLPVHEPGTKQSNGMTNKQAAPAGHRNKPSAGSARKDRPPADRPARDRGHKNRDENAAPREAAASGNDHQPDVRQRGPRPNRPQREPGHRPAGDRRPDGMRRPDGPAGPAGATTNRPRGPRTFSNQQKVVPPVVVATDEFPNSIDTWSNTTADPSARPAPAPITSMTVGNWSDVVSGANEDWSEEDYESSLMETKVFVPSGKSLPETDELPASTTHVQSEKRGPGPPPAPQLDRKEAAGAQILQSLKQPVSQAGYGQPNQSFINKQAADSIKSLVGIPTAAYSTTVAPPGQLAEAKPVAAAATRPVNTNRRSTRIPETPVEMPTNDSVGSLGVQFGALDVNFSVPDVSVKSDIQTLNHKSAIPANATFEQQAKSVLATDMMKRHEALAAKPEPAIDPRNAVAKHVKSAIDSVKGPDLYSVSGSQTEFKGNTAYPNAGSYSSYSGMAASTSAQFSAYANPSTYASSSYSTNNYPSVAHKNITSNLKDMDSAAQHKSSPYDMQSPAGLVNSTQTTNVLKNSLSATGKGNMGNANMPRMPMTQLMHPSYIMGGMPSTAFYPVYDPSMQMPPTGGQDAGGYAAAYNQSADASKFSRTDGVSDGSSGSSAGVSSQAPVVSQHSQQQFISPLPPGYGFYYMPSAPGLFPPQGGPFVPLPPVSSAHASGAPGFPKASYASHSYAATGYEATGMPIQADYTKAQAYGQNPNQHQTKSMPSNDLMGQSSSYNKSHGAAKVSIY